MICFRNATVDHLCVSKGEGDMMKRLLIMISCVFAVVLISGVCCYAADGGAYTHPFPGGTNWNYDPGIFIEDQDGDWNGDGKTDGTDRFGGAPNDGVLEWPAGTHYIGGHQGGVDNVGGGIPAGAKLILQPGTTLIFASGGYMSVGGTLNAQGTSSQPIIFTCEKKEKGSWGGVTFASSSGDECIMKYCTVEYGSEWAMVNVIGDNNPNGPKPSPDFENCIFRCSSKVGFKIMYDCNPVIRNCSFEDNTEWPIAISNCMKKGFEFPGCTVSGNGNNGIIITSYQGDIYVPDDVIFYSGIPYYLGYGMSSGTHTISVDDNAKLYLSNRITIEPGGQFTAEPGACIYGLTKDASVYSYGKVTAVGTKKNPITFTSGMPSPAPGDWNGLFISRSSADGSVLQYCNFSYAGSYNYGNLALGDQYADKPLTDILIEHCTFSNSKYDGLKLFFRSEATVHNCNFINNVSCAMNAWECPIAGEYSGNAGSGNGLNSLVFDTNGSDLASSPDTVLEKNAIGYYFNKWITIPKGASLTLEAGAVADYVSGIGFDGGKLVLKSGSRLKMAKGSSIRVNNGGLLISSGTKKSPVLITSAEKSPNPGDWGGICFYSASSASCSLVSTIVEYGGASFLANIRLGWDYNPVPAGCPVLKDCETRYSSNAGIWIGHGSKSTITGCISHNNANYGLAIDQDPAPSLSDCKFYKNGKLDIMYGGTAKLNVSTCTYSTTDKPALMVKSGGSKPATGSSGKTGSSSKVTGNGKTAPKTPTAAPAPKAGSKKISGATSAGASVVVKVNGKTKGTVKADAKGNYTISLTSALKSNDKLEITASLNGLNSGVLKVTVK